MSDIASESAAAPQKSAIPQTIAHFTSRIRAIRECASEHIKFAEATQVTWLKGFLEEHAADHRINADGGLEFKLNIEMVTELTQRLETPHSQILSESLLIFGFSTFDAYVGLLLRNLYREVPTLLFNIEEKKIEVSDLLNSKNLEEVVERIIDKDISGLLRSSYDDQFSVLATRHGLSTLKKIPAWPDFIEAAQRRNLITHCNGTVNSQYTNACSAAGFKLDASIVDGHRLTVDTQYLRNALDTLYDVGVRLGHTLWRKATSECIPISEQVLTDELFGLLTREEWHLAKRIGEFAINIPNQKVELQKRISRINYAQSLKWSGDDAGAMKVLDAVDWSGSIRDLRLGVEVLRGNYDNAVALMREIGRKGELVGKKGYLYWPVFREFRSSEQFKIAFAEIYGATIALESNGQPPIIELDGQASESAKDLPLDPPNSEQD